MKSTYRFVGWESAHLLSMIDIDVSIFAEYDDATKEPLALVESAKDVGQDYKNATVTKNLARRANMPAFVLLFKPATVPNKADTRWPDIERFRVKQIWPTFDKQWKIYTPKEWAEFLLGLRKRETTKIEYDCLSATVQCDEIMF